MGIIPARRQVKSVPSFYDLNMLVFGLQKTGKTSFYSGDEECVTAACEPGSDFIASRPVNIDSFKTFGEVLKEISMEPFKYSGLVIDTVDVLYDLCFDYVCELEGVKYPPRNDFGKVFNRIKKKWESGIIFAMNQVPVRFITHAETQPIKIKKGSGIVEETERVIQRFHGRKSKFLDATVNCVGYMDTTFSGRRTISFAQNAYVAAGDRTGILEKLGTIELPERADQGFAYVAGLYQEKAESMGFQITHRRK